MGSHPKFAANGFNKSQQRRLKLSFRMKVCTYSVLSLLWLSGALWFLTHYFGAETSEFFSNPHPSQRFLIPLHGFFAFAFLIILGSLIPNHMVMAIRKGKNVRNGIFFLVVCGLMVLSGYSLYYASQETLRELAEWVHHFVGLGFPIIFAYHVWSGKRSTKKSNHHRSDIVGSNSKDIS